MRKIYHLKTCDTCRRILRQIPHIEQFELQDIKEHPLTAAQLDELYQRSKSYEKLTNKRAKLWKEMGLNHETLTETDYRHYLLEHYTFLARPVVLIDQSTFIGNSPKTIQALLQHLNHE